jgi:hypothetical protein
MAEVIPLPVVLEGQRGPTMATIEEIELILRKANGPISLNEIKRRMRAKSVPHATVRLAVNHLIRYGLVVEGSKGVMWVPPASASLREAIRAGRRL